MQFLTIMYKVSLSALLIGSQPAYTQQETKPALDTTALRNWPSIFDDGQLSNDGKYFCYSLKYFARGQSIQILQSISSPWKMEFNGASQPVFSADSRLALFTVKDTLNVLTLGTNQIQKIPGVSSFQTVENGKDNFAAYLGGKSYRSLNLMDLTSGKETRFENVNEFIFSRSAKALVFVNDTSVNEGATAIKWLNLKTGQINRVWAGDAGPTAQKLSSYSLDEAGTQLTFITSSTHENTIWYYKEGWSGAIVKAQKKSKGIGEGLFIAESTPYFSHDGRYIYFQLQQREEGLPAIPGLVPFDVWSYTDIKNQNRQKADGHYATGFVSCIAVESDRVVQLTHGDDYILADPYKGDYVVVFSDKTGDRYWLKDSLITYYLVSLRDGSRKDLKIQIASVFYFSPEGKYLIYFNSFNKFYNWHCLALDLKLGTTRDVSAELPPGTLDGIHPYDRCDTLPNRMGPQRIAAWGLKDQYFLVYSEFDIYKIDPSGKQPPLNVTNGFGQKNEVKLRLINGMTTNIDFVQLQQNRHIIISAFDTRTKNNSFYSFDLKDVPANPQFLSAHDAVIYRGNRDDLANATLPLNYFTDKTPEKAKNKNVWLVGKQSATEAPNYYLTEDFKTFKALTHLHPHLKWNWLTSTLIHYPQLDGQMNQGILYRPEHFDSTKKYPVIINFYEQVAYRLHEYPVPRFIQSVINIPWFVSQGYLVFTPDIYLSERGRGKSACNSVVGAALHLSSLPYVDSTKIGINGHSAAGYLTNYIITHTHKFAAAVSGAGSADWISSYLAVTKDGLLRGELHEGSMQASLWERPDLYIKASTVFQLNEVTTPVLFFNSESDYGSPFEQALEMFSGLRRLNKPSWILQYDGQPHGNNGPAAVDWTLRMTQFFDHYLKGKPAPVWMAKGIPAHLKGKVSGLELTK